MMKGLRRSVVLAILAMGAGAWFAEPLAAQETAQLPADVGDLSNAQFLFVKDSTGAIVLRGRLFRQSKGGEKIEREGALIGTGKFAKATGDAEVEVKQVGELLHQEVELEVKGLAPKATYTVSVDSKQVGTLTTDEHGEGALEMKTSPAPGTAPANP